MTDTGIGIPAEHLPHIFERFYQVDAARASGGCGLGLSICRWIVRAHGGTIEARSAPGEGTDFTVEAADVRLGPAPIPAPPPSSPTARLEDRTPVIPEGDRPDDPRRGLSLATGS